MLGRLLDRFRPRPGGPVPVVLYTRPGCPLCDEMKAELARARGSFELVEVNVEEDDELLARHGRSVPVLVIAGKVAFKGRMSAPDFERKLARRARELRAAPPGDSAHG